MAVKGGHVFLAFQTTQGLMEFLHIANWLRFLQQHVSVNLPNEAGFRIEFVLNYPVTVNRISDS